MENLKSLKEIKIIDGDSFDIISAVISYSKKLKEGFEFIMFDNLFQADQIEKSIEAFKILQKQLNNTTYTSPIDKYVERINERISSIKLNNYKGNLNNFI